LNPFFSFLSRLLFSVDGDPFTCDQRFAANLQLSLALSTSLICVTVERSEAGISTPTIPPPVPRSFHLLTDITSISHLEQNGDPPHLGSIAQIWNDISNKSQYCSKPHSTLLRHQHCIRAAAISVAAGAAGSSGPGQGSEPRR